MCNPACINFGSNLLTSDDIKNKEVLEIGSRNVNGSLRHFVESHGPARYHGIDIESGPGVDEVCDIYQTVQTFGESSFDVVICTEVFEHLRHWRDATIAIKTILRPGGVLILTTRSFGFAYHGYPFDFWRYELNDMKKIFSDFEIIALESDPLMPGVFIYCKKPKRYAINNLENIQLFSVVTNERCLDINQLDLMQMKLRKRARQVFDCLPLQAKSAIKTLARR